MSTIVLKLQVYYIMEVICLFLYLFIYGVFARFMDILLLNIKH